MTKILVAYATKHNSTAEIAHFIGKVLQEAGGMQVELRSVERVPDITVYDAVVLGSAVYMGQWQKAAAEFLMAHEQELASRPVWLFSSGPLGEKDRASQPGRWTFPEGLQPVADRIQPRNLGVFHGNLDPARLGFFERFIARMVKSPTGDFRDWQMIRSWAEGIAQALAVPQQAV